jgi:hypothetical protein
VARRFAIWPEVCRFIEALPVGTGVADVSCGNGKVFVVRRDVAIHGSDRSASLCVQSFMVETFLH